MSDIYKIKPANLEALFEKIEKLNRKATKLGCEPAVVTVVGSKMVKASKVMPGGRILKYEYEVKLVTVTGDTPPVGGVEPDRQGRVRQRRADDALRARRELP